MPKKKRVASTNANRRLTHGNGKGLGTESDPVENKEANKQQETVVPNPTVEGHEEETTLVRTRTNVSKGKEVKDQASAMSVDTVLRFPNIPGAAHELAAIL